MELDTDPNELVLTRTEEDPEGADRGGFHQETHTLTIDGPKLVVTVEVEAKVSVEVWLANARQKVADLEAFLANLEKVETVQVCRPGRTMVLEDLIKGDE